VKRDFSRFLTTTALVSMPSRSLPPSNTRPPRSSGITISNCSISNCGSGIVQVKRHRAPQISEYLLQMIELAQPEFVTRHIEERYLEGALNGYFRFGTLINYRAVEGAIAGRLGDHQESRVQEVFNSRSSFFETAILEGIEVTNTSFGGTANQIVVETIVNDFCSCASIGEFSLTRGVKIRDCESDPAKKPSAYVTYHLPTLKAALKEHLSCASEQSCLNILGRNVEYGQKDRHWEVEKNFSYQQDRDALAIWLGIAFVKSLSFEHEDEYRLLLIDPSGPGGLNDDAKTYEISESTSIASSIVASGNY
jgi:hypothetical protein